MTIKHVIIPVDFSEVSIAAVDHGRWLADRSTSTLELVAVTTPRYAKVTAAALTSLAQDHDLDAEFRSFETANDDIEGTLVETVVASTDSLWCVGSHGRTALGELLFGSVSADLVRDAEVPIVVVGPHAKVRADGDVLAVALDGTPASESILPAAVAIAGELGLRLRLLQVGLAHVPADAADTNYLAGLSHHLPDPENADYDTPLRRAGRGADRLPRTQRRGRDDRDGQRGVPAGSPVGAEHCHAGDASGRRTRADAAPNGDRRPHRPRRPRLERARPAPPGGGGVDTYEASKPAVDWAADEAARRDAVLQVVHTWHIPVGAHRCTATRSGFDIEACRNAAIDEVHATAHAIAEVHPELLIETIVAEGGAAQAITDQSVGADLVVLGSATTTAGSPSCWSAPPASRP
ncbi:MAG: universal stress protein [Ilumatobacteraceae bacterium]